MAQRKAANGLAHQIGVGHLECHTDCQRQIAEVVIVGTPAAEIDSAVRRRVVQPGVAQGVDRVDSSPGQRDAD